MGNPNLNLPGSYDSTIKLRSYENQVKIMNAHVVNINKNHNGHNLLSGKTDEKIYYTCHVSLLKAFFFLYDVSDFDRKCCKSPLSLFLKHFVQAHPLTIVINNQTEQRLIYVTIEYLKTHVL